MIVDDESGRCRVYFSNLSRLLCCSLLRLFNIFMLYFTSNDLTNKFIRTITYRYYASETYK